MRKEATAEFHQISMPAFQSPSVRRSRFARIPGEVVGCASEDAQSTEPNRPSSLRVRILTAILRTFTTLRTAFTPLLAQETTAHDRQARHQTSAVLLLLGWGLLWRRLLVAHRRLLVAILLGRRWAVAGLLLVLAWRRAGFFGVRSANCVIFSFRSAPPTTGGDLQKIWFFGLGKLTRMLAAVAGGIAAGPGCSSLGWPFCFAICWVEVADCW